MDRAGVASGDAVGVQWPRELGVWLLLLASGLWPWLLTAAETGLTVWIWLSLWAPVAGTLSTGLKRSRWAWSIPLLWGLALLYGPPSATYPLRGALVVAALYFAGSVSCPGGAWAWSRAGLWLLLGSLLCALPAAGGVWAALPPSNWVSASLDLSPVVLVCEHAGFDWMRHISVYEQAGAGDLGPEQRMAWSGARLPWLAFGFFACLALLRRGQKPSTLPG